MAGTLTVACYNKRAVVIKVLYVVIKCPQHIGIGKVQCLCPIVSGIKEGVECSLPVMGSINPARPVKY